MCEGEREYDVESSDTQVEHDCLHCTRGLSALSTPLERNSIQMITCQSRFPHAVLTPEGLFSGHGYSSSCPEGSPDVPLPACAPSFDCVGLPHPLHNDDAATSFIITTRSTISVSNCTSRPPARLPTTALQCLRSLGLPPPPSAPLSSALPGRRGASVCTTRTSTPRTRYAPHSARVPRAASERTRDSSPRAPPVPAEHAVRVR